MREVHEQGQQLEVPSKRKERRAWSVVAALIVLALLASCAPVDTRAQVQAELVQPTKTESVSVEELSTLIAPTLIPTIPPLSTEYTESMMNPCEFGFWGVRLAEVEDIESLNKASLSEIPLYTTKTVQFGPDNEPTIVRFSWNGYGIQVTTQRNEWDGPDCSLGDPELVGEYGVPNQTMVAESNNEGEDRCRFAFFWEYRDNRSVAYIARIDK